MRSRRSDRPKGRAVALETADRGDSERGLTSSALRGRMDTEDSLGDDSGDDADLSDSCDEIRGIFDKRPRFERKIWAGIAEGGQPISRPCAPIHGTRERRRSCGRA